MSENESDIKVKDGSFQNKADIIWNNIKVLRILVLAGFIIIMFFNSWMCDDAYHGFVMAKHLKEGEGFVYNLGERVNAATNPLFILIVTAFDMVSDSMYISATLVSFLFSTGAALILLFKFCDTRIKVAEAFVLLCTCGSFMTYTTSGLENCLLFFLSGVFMYIVLSREEFGAKELLILALLISVIAMTRMDNALIVAPVIVYIYLFRRKNVSFLKCVGIGITGLLPLVIWELFSLFYFGSLVPNTAYIKLNTGIAMSTYIRRGLEYTAITFLNDILVVVLPVAAVIFCCKKKDNKYRMLAAGIIVYFLYLLRVGGDFMLGRHFTVIYYVAAILVLKLQGSMEDKNSKSKRNLCLAGLISVSFISLMTSRILGRQFLWHETWETKAKIADEREFYYPTTGLIPNAMFFISYNDLSTKYTWAIPEIEEMRKKGQKRKIVEWAAGIVVYYNRDLYLQDYYGLGDPLLSHLPAELVDEEQFRVGHMHRKIPEGYAESVENNDNEIKDPSLHEFYDKILLITRGDLWDSDRLKAIVDLNTGKYDHLIESYIKESGK